MVSDAESWTSSGGAMNLPDRRWTMRRGIHSLLLARPESLEIGPIGQQNTVARIAVARHLNEGDGQLLDLDVQLFVHDIADTFDRPAFLLGSTACQHRDLYVRHAHLLQVSPEGGNVTRFD